MSLLNTLQSLPLYERIFAIVEQIPAGNVATYGQVAEIAGCSARQVGYALATLPLQSPIPWQRVINSQGKISLRGRGSGEVTQKELLRAEGVHFSDNGIADLGKYRCLFPDIK
jgi:methylated-DNA-protein-cysteine methyltransferase-like protein